MTHFKFIVPVLAVVSSLVVTSPSVQASPGPCDQSKIECTMGSAYGTGGYQVPTQHRQENTYIHGLGLFQTYTSPLGSGASSTVTHGPNGGVTICQGGPGMTTICH